MAKKKAKAQKGRSGLRTAREALQSRKEGTSRKQARKSIHPNYVPCKIVCACGNVVETRATVPEIQVGVCSNCHPFFTGTQKFVDAAGRVEKFQRRYKWNATQALDTEDKGSEKKKKP